MKYVIPLLVSILLGGCSGNPCSGIEVDIELSKHPNLNYIWAQLLNTSNEPKLVTFTWINPEGRNKGYDPISLDAKGVERIKIRAINPSVASSVDELMAKRSYELSCQ